MSRTKTITITAEEAIALVEKRRRQARGYYARMREDALRYRKAQQNAETPPAGEQHNTK